MGASANAGITNLNPATDFLRDGADAIDRLGDELIDKLIGAHWAYADQSVTSMATGADTLVTLDTLIRDDFSTYLGGGAWYAGSPTFGFLCRAAGRYEVWGIVSFAAGTIGTRRGCHIRKNGTAIEGGTAIYGSSAAAVVVNTPVAVVDLVAADVLQLYGFQDSGAALNTVAGSPNRSVLNVRRMK